MEALGKAFVDHFYTTFGNNRGGLASLYHDDSLLAFDGHHCLGVHNIMEKLNSLPFHRCRHQIITFDWLPSPITGGLFVLISGKIQIAGKTQVHNFTEMFHLVPLTWGGCYVLNDIFRLNSG